MVSQILKEQSAYSASFRALQEGIGAGSPSWIERLRESAFSSFEQLGFPTTALEEWKYTNVAPIAKAKFDAAFARAKDAHLALDASQLQAFAYKEAHASQLVFVNGFYRPELSSVEALPEAFAVLDIADALKEEKYAEILREQLARSADFNHNAFTALNTAFIASGAFLLIPKGVQLEVPVHLLFLSDGHLSPTASFPRVLIVAESGSTATVIESYAGLG